MSAYTFLCRYPSVALLVSMCLCGCNDSPKDAEAILHVRRELVAGTDRDFMVYKNTQRALLTSTFVVNRALRNNTLPRNLTAKQLTSELEVDVDDETDLIMIRLPVGNRTAKQAEAIVDAIVSAYQSEVVNRDRLEKVEKLANLRKRYQNVYDDIVKETEQIKSLAERLGSTEIQNSGVQAKLQLEVGKTHLLYLQQRMVELQLERLDEPEAEDESSSIDAKIKFMSELVTEQKDQLRSFGGTSGELQARVDTLDALRATLKHVEESKSKLEIELEGRERVYVIQDAYAK